MIDELGYIIHPDIHRVYPHTRCFGGVAMHNLHWDLIAMKNKVDVDFIVKMSRIRDEAKIIMKRNETRRNKNG
jgi:hypothetical protein